MPVVFKVYDFNNDGYLSKDEMLALLKGCLTNSYVASDEDVDEGQKELCDIVTKKLVSALNNFMCGGVVGDLVGVVKG